MLPIVANKDAGILVAETAAEAKVEPQKRAKKEALDFLFCLLENAAITEVRCPDNEEITDALHQKHLKATFKKGDCKEYMTAILCLAHSGRIKIEIWGKNWRVVEIRQGKNKGKRTMACPDRSKMWREICGSTNMRNGKTVTHKRQAAPIQTT